MGLLVPLQTIETHDCYITFLQADHHELVLKQIKNPSFDEQFLLVLEALGAYIAEECEIPVNRTRLVPIGTNLTEKQIATLHTKAAGRSLDTWRAYEDLDIQQRIRKRYVHTWQTELPDERLGLSAVVIKNMLKHPDLSKITALDTFVGNADRSSPNLFYDEMSNSFTGIDMAASFSSELGKQAYLRLSVMDAIEYDLSEYQNTLEALLTRFPPEKQKALLISFAQEAGFYEGGPFWNQDIEERIQFHNKCIDSNYHWCQKLVQMISDKCISLS